MSLPSAVATIRQASATAAPPLDPPALRSSPHGLRVTPYTSLNVCEPAPNSGVFVLPTATAPAAFMRADEQAVGRRAVAGEQRRAVRRREVGRLVEVLVGRDEPGERAGVVAARRWRRRPPRARRRPTSGSRATMALTAGLTASMRARWASSSSHRRDLSAPRSVAAARLRSSSTKFHGPESSVDVVTVLRVALAQLNPTVGDLDGNLAQLVDAYDRAEAAGCDIVAFPELAITGYPPEDLVLKPGFVADNEAALGKLAARTRHCAAVVGFVDEDRDLFNAAAVCAGGEVLGTYRKRLLPNYAVFDEARYFTPGNETDPLELYVIGGVKVGISICEDVWSPDGPLAVQADGGAELADQHQRLAVPPRQGRLPRADAGHPRRRRPLGARVRQPGRRSGRAGLRRLLAGVRRRGQPARPRAAVRRGAADRRRARCPPSTASGCSTRVAASRSAPLPHGRRQRGAGRARRRRSPTPLVEPLDPDAELYEALVLGTRDYCAQERLHRRRHRALRRHRLDARRRRSPPTRSAPSTCTACRCRRATRATTPSPTPPLLAENLGIDYRTIAIEPAFAAYLDMLAPSFAGRPPGLTQENLQSRCRGQLLMALSNEFGWMVLTTGNKSEMAVGYFTIYGDSVGGYAVIKDVLKTEVYALCRYVNERAGREIIPEARDHQAAVGRAAPGPARRPEPAAVRGARPDPRGSTSRRTARPARSSSSATTRPSSGGSPGSSTSPSTSAASARPACG